VWEKAKKEGIFKVFKEAMNRLDEPFPLGYSAAGTVVEVGNSVSDFSIGDKVAIAGSGYASHAEYNFVPENLCMKIPLRKEGEHLDFEEAAFCMVGGIALQGIREAGLTFGENVVVIGLGLLGLVTVQILQAVGCGVVGIDIDDRKCRLAEKLGCEKVYSDAESLIVDCQDKMDAVLITAATEDDGPLQTAQKIIRQRGKIVLVGVCNIQLDRKDFWDKEIEFRVSKAAGPGVSDDNYEVLGIDYPVEYVRWPEKKNMEYFLKLVSQGRVEVRELITHKFEISKAVSVYKMLLEGKEFYIGTMLEYPKELPDKDQLKKFDIVVRKNSSAAYVQDKRANVGFIGGGMFTKNILLPTLAKTGNVNLIGIATTRGITSEHISSKFGFNYATSDYQRLLQDPDIGSVFITTRHDMHAKIVVEALKANKRVFVEKPLCLNKAELSDIVDAYNTSNSMLMVGFNRRYSPCAEDMKKFLGQAGPFVVNYRINAGYIDAEHWTQDGDIGGGRIIGEVCHFVDYLQFIIGSKPVRVSAESIRSTEKYKTDDNVIAVVNFEDGSVGAVTYTSQGSKAYPREIIEVFRDESVYYLEDFKKVIKVKGGRRKKSTYFSQDMGYGNEIKHFITQEVSAEQTRENFVNALTVFSIVESLKSGKPVLVEDI
jgi:predicted dehydrogenase